jgi:anti-sigma factor RsiW
MTANHRAPHDGQHDEYWLTAGLDGELDAERSLQLEDRLARDAAFRAEWERRVALRDALRAGGRVHEVPPSLEARLRWAIAGEGVALDGSAPALQDDVTAPIARVPDPARGRPAGSRPALDRRTWIVAAGSALAASFATLAVLRALPPSAGGSVAPVPAPDPLLAMADDAIAGHARAFLAERVVEVESTNRHTVKPWLSAHLPFSPLVPDLSAHGFELVGARRDLLGAQAVAALVYRRRLHVISAFVQPDAGPDRAPVTRHVRGFNAIAFVRGGMAWCVVSDLDEHELGDLADLLRAA